MALTQVKGSILSDELYRRENNLSDVLDKTVARNNLSVFAKNDFVNFIFMFAGFEADIPDGFQLCNGVGQTSNGINIPDLKDRFIIGSGGAYSTGSKGGSSSSSTSSAGSHSHSVSVGNTTLSISQIPSHNHNILLAQAEYITLGPGGNHYQRPQPPGTDTTFTGGSGSHSHSVSSGDSGNHSHSVNITPPYYALAFIIKL